MGVLLFPAENTLANTLAILVLIPLKALRSLRNFLRKQTWAFPSKTSELPSRIGSSFSRSLECNPFFCPSILKLARKCSRKLGVNLPCLYFQPNDFWATQQTRSSRLLIVPGGPSCHKNIWKGELRVRGKFSQDPSNSLILLLSYFGKLITLLLGAQAPLKICNEATAMNVLLDMSAPSRHGSQFHLTIPHLYYITLYNKISTITKGLYKL